ncbi:bifunctional UDP-N-acetylglucosamine diphosphorylase/glucosamine-1-phosphate N-acetyltransferase GlmU [uncultured Desulfovibrio sp.]|uniref:bifunctional UDP-N-acetylglucosamine diphosphorylase/glucosamine-1-phosphate N-acetyltransferase GlmU n=1 Tax=uncultured Desulfovibrio sp. TaxID=167968 RepID=UPI0003AA13A5|nr:bifunctional UDP-N-acetylglucosamine diphosphorylase/glucosamine-1-phosphate N-acetyltransferase GlmU [uncultured Desulfovibrio sp.]
MSKNMALILAAGKGTRMHSDRPKVLQTLLGESMLTYVRAALRPVFDEEIWMVVGHRAEMVEAAFPDARLIFQTEQLGTGHALMRALPALSEAGCTHLLVVNGDAPLLSETLVRDFLAEATGAELAFATIVLDNPGAYGRVVRKQGRVLGIVEAKDYDLARHGPESGEVNAGMYQFSLAVVESLLPRLSNDNRSGEYYITDLIGLAVAENYTVRGVECGRDDSLLGVNSPLELSRMEELLRARTAEQLLDSGVILHAPDLIRVSPQARIEPGAELTGPCEICGRTEIQRGASVASHCVVRDCLIREGAEIRSFSHLEGARVGAGALVGPFARLRPGTELDAESHVGNFVELKKACLGKGAKANHLSYLGDARIGAGANIGAGTITCNYDGKHKYQTSIGEKAFIGSNTALVAPVSVGDNALVGAGSVITKDVPADEMGIARGRQKNFSRRG